MKRGQVGFPDSPNKNSVHEVYLAVTGVVTVMCPSLNQLFHSRAACSVTHCSAKGPSEESSPVV